MSDILDKYEAGNYTLAETILEVGMQVGHQAVVDSDLYEADGVIEKAGGSSGLNLCLITAAGIFEKVSDDFIDRWDQETIWGSGDWIVAIDGFAGDLSDFIRKSPDLFAAPNGGDDVAKKEFETTITAMAVKWIEEASHVKWTEEENQ